MIASPPGTTAGTRLAEVACGAPIVACLLAVLTGPIRGWTTLDDALPSNATLVAATSALVVLVLLLDDPGAVRGSVRACGVLGSFLVGVSVLHLAAVADKPAAIPVAGYGGLTLGLFLLVVAGGSVPDRSTSRGGR